MSSSRVLGSFLLAIPAALVLSCALPGSTSEMGTENQPGPGSAVIRGSPPISSEAIVIEFVGPEGDVFAQQTARIPPGNNIEARIWSLPGEVHVKVDGSLCEGEIALESDVLTLVTLHLEVDSCAAETIGVRPLG